MSVFQEMFRRLTDTYTKKEDSNIGKVLLLLSEQIDDLNESFVAIENYRDLNQATGSTLDLIGKAIGQPRGKATDEVYRILLRARIARNASDGTTDKIINALALALNTDPSDIRISELTDGGVYEPATVGLVNLPIEALLGAGMTATQFGILLQRVVAAGVRVASVDLTGSFQLSESVDSSVIDNDKGLANLDQTTGGTLSGSFSPEDEVELPI
ncbi:DUF2612 domain-containing protein [Exiguobacterium sp. S3]|uniref:DUF2612 domain-containing protein n=1 Tax=Exiguobacterium sp. S3 TaxID=483245 RepID=UPI001BE6D095|nr:DUF2612 domain-containing protein [Exiguobacterium sp. S3]